MDVGERGRFARAREREREKERERERENENKEKRAAPSRCETTFGTLWSLNPDTRDICRQIDTPLRTLTFR